MATTEKCLNRMVLRHPDARPVERGRRALFETQRTTMRCFSALAVTACLTIAQAQALAAPQQSNSLGPISFSTFDSNGDGVVSAEEFEAARNARVETRKAEGRPQRGAASALSFEDFDADGNGEISPAELDAARQTRIGQRGTKRSGGAQAGGPGPRDKMYAGAGSRPNFGDFDLNGDGSVSQAEFDEAREKKMAVRSEQGYGMQNLPGRPGFSDLDANSDGRVTAEEFREQQALRRSQNVERR